MAVGVPGRSRRPHLGEPDGLGRRDPLPHEGKQSCPELPSPSRGLDVHGRDYMPVRIRSRSVGRCPLTRRPAMPSAEPIRVGGPYFEDFEVGQVYDAPALTLTSGHAAIHQALVGDRMLLPLDATLSAEVTGHAQPLAHPNLVCDVAIGQSTTPTQRVRGNLFYRGLVLLRPVFIGDTLRTRTEIVGLRQNRPRADGSATGLVALRIRSENQAGEGVLDFWRCPMTPLRDASARAGHADGFADT